MNKKSFNVIFLFTCFSWSMEEASSRFLSPPYRTIQVGVQVRIYCRLDSGDIVPVRGKDTQGGRDTVIVGTNRDNECSSIQKKKRRQVLAKSVQLHPSVESVSESRFLTFRRLPPNGRSGCIIAYDRSYIFTFSRWVVIDDDGGKGRGQRACDLNSGSVIHTAQQRSRELGRAPVTYLSMWLTEKETG
jgi:hypothetical protein